MKKLNLSVETGQVHSDGLGRMAVTNIAARVSHCTMPIMSQVFGHFGVEGRFDYRLGQLLQHSVLAQQVSGLFVVCNHMIEQSLWNRRPFVRFNR